MTDATCTYTEHNLGVLKEISVAKFTNLSCKTHRDASEVLETCPHVTTFRAQGDFTSMRVLELYYAGELSADVAQTLLPRPLATYSAPQSQGQKRTAEASGAKSRHDGNPK